jgi:nicotinamidase-related amidase
MHNYTEEELLTLAKRAYREGIARFDILPENCALLVIDMQDEFVKPGSTFYWVPEATRQVPRINQLVNACRQSNIPIIWTTFAKTHEYYDRPISGKYMPNRLPELGPGDPAWFTKGNIYEEMAVQPGDIIIHKPSYGAFYDTPLETILRHMGKDTVIICGCLTNYCCGTTARQAYERSFKVVFGSDVNATDDPAMQESELMTLRKGFAHVLSADDIEAAISLNN